ncbi:MAG: NAD-dependent epimerase/dehydratase family protein [Chitinophagaceae bacterium]|nr:NAD-dependent epimerase/dehydratase family protein [Chitinophagaceae bacterium]
MQTAGIIGGAGFIGSWVTKIFLENNFKVKVSSTDISNKAKYEHLYQLNNAGNLEICPLDLLQPESIAAFSEGCDIIVHGGTPFLLEVKDPQTELFEPTVKGTQNFLEVVNNTAGIKKVVFIASVAAWNTSFPLNPSGFSSNYVFSENDTPYISENDHPYAQAKFYADQAVRKFIGQNKELRFEIVSISPVFVTGNILSARQDSTSMGMQYLFKNSIAPNPFVEMLFANDVPFAMVDVRNVAESIFSAATKKGLHGKNYLLASETYKVSDITRMLNGQAPLDAPAYTYSNALASIELGVLFIPAKETLNHCI